MSKQIKDGDKQIKDGDKRNKDGDKRNKDGDKRNKGRKQIRGFYFYGMKTKKHKKILTIL